MPARCSGKSVLQRRGGAAKKDVYQAPPPGTSTLTASIFNLAKNIIGVSGMPRHLKHMWT